MKNYMSNCYKFFLCAAVTSAVLTCNSYDKALGAGLPGNVMDGLSEVDTFEFGKEIFRLSRGDFKRLMELSNDPIDRFEDDNLPRVSQIMNKMWYPNPMLVYNLLNADGLVHSALSGSKKLESNSRLISLSNGLYNMGMDGLVGNVNTAVYKRSDNSGMLKAMKSDNSGMLGMPLDAIAGSMAAHARYEVYDGLTVGVLLNLSKVGTSGGSDTKGKHSILDYDAWSKIDAVMNQYSLGVSVTYDKINNVVLWAGGAYGLGRQGSSRQISHVGGRKFDLELLDALSNIKMKKFSLESENTITSHSLYMNLGAEYSKRFYGDKFGLTSSVEINYSGHSISAFTEANAAPFEDEVKRNAADGLDMKRLRHEMYAIESSGASFSRWNIKPKIMIDFADIYGFLKEFGFLKELGGTIRIGTYVTANINPLSKYNEVKFPIKLALPKKHEEVEDSNSEETKKFKDVDIRTDDGFFSPGFGLMVSGGNQNFHYTLVYEKLFLDNDYEDRMELVVKFTI